MKQNEKSAKDMIIEDAIKKFKSGEIKTGGDVEDFLDNLIQPILQKMLEIELDGHLEYSKYERTGKKNDNNTRNGYCKEKKVETKYGQITLKTPRDRNGSFQPIIVEKGQTKLTGFEDKCISLYAKGVSLRDIEEILTDFYGVKINKDTISKMISEINEEVETFRNRPLKSLYTFAYADCLYIPIKEDLKSEKKAIYVIIGIDACGYKEVLGIWMDKTESANFWASVFEELKQRGVQDILYMSSDGLAGFKGSLETVFEKTATQRCIVHLCRNLYKISPKKEASKILGDFKKIYNSTSLEIAQLQLEDFKKKYEKQEKIVEKVESFMPFIEPLFELPEEIRKMIYTTNIVESVNSALRKVTNGKGSFPSEEAVYKVLYLRVKDLRKKWDKPIKNFNIIQSQLISLFGERYTKHISI